MTKTAEIELKQRVTLEQQPNPVDALTLAEDDAPEPIQRRLLRPQTLISFAIAIVIVGLVIQRLDINLSDVWTNLKAADPLLFLAALAVYYATFVARTYRWRYMLRQSGVAAQPNFVMPGIPRLFEILMLSWFANCVIPAKLGDGYRSYLLRRDAGATVSGTLGTILAERLTDLAVLFVLMSTAAVITFHGDLPSRVLNTMLIGGGLMLVAGLAVTILLFSKSRILRFIPDRFERQFDQFHDAVFACLRNPTFPILVSVGIWAADGFRLYLVARSLGVELSISLTIFVALMSALLTTLPITPAGLGVVEAAVIVVLNLVDVGSVDASSIAILDRVVGYWSLIVVGIVLYLFRMRRAVVAPAPA